MVPVNMWITHCLFHEATQRQMQELPFRQRWNEEVLYSAVQETLVDSRTLGQIPRHRGLKREAGKPVT